MKEAPLVLPLTLSTYGNIFFLKSFFRYLQICQLPPHPAVGRLLFQSHISECCRKRAVGVQRNKISSVYFVVFSLVGRKKKRVVKVPQTPACAPVVVSALMWWNITERGPSDCSAGRMTNFCVKGGREVDESTAGVGVGEF